MLQLLGAILFISAALGAVVFHFGWQSRHPGTRWPVKAIASFGSGAIGATGLMLGSWLVGIAGVVLYLAARLIPLSPSA